MSVTYTPKRGCLSAVAIMLCVAAIIGIVTHEVRSFPPVGPAPDPPIASGPPKPVPPPKAETVRPVEIVAEKPKPLIKTLGEKLTKAVAEEGVRLYQDKLAQAETRPKAAPREEPTQGDPAESPETRPEENPIPEEKPPVKRAPASTPQKTAPRPAAPVAPAQPPAPVMLPPKIEVAIEGPSSAVVGQLPRFKAKLTGPVDVIEWRVSPRAEGLEVLADVRKCVFSNAPGVYYIRALIGGAGQVDEDELEFEILPLDDEPQEATKVKKPPPKAVPEATDMDLGGEVVSQVNKVQSATRKAEAKIVGGVFRKAAARAESGQLPPEADIMQDVLIQLRTDLGVPSATLWLEFLQWAKLQVAVRQQHGLSPAQFLNELAAILARIK